MLRKHLLFCRPVVKWYNIKYMCLILLGLIALYAAVYHYYRLITSNRFADREGLSLTILVPFLPIPPRNKVATIPWDMHDVCYLTTTRYRRNINHFDQTHLIVKKFNNFMKSCYKKYTDGTIIQPKTKSRNHWTILALYDWTVNYLHRWQQSWNVDSILGRNATCISVILFISTS